LRRFSGRGHCSTLPNQGPDRTWITDVRIISPEKLDHIENGSVLIENAASFASSEKKEQEAGRRNNSFG